jgi:hypothetical protein
MDSGETTYSGETLVKIIHSDKRQGDFVYKTGLNILNKPFQPEGSCVSGGFYYTKLKYIHNYYYFGELIVIIKIPDDAQVVKDSDETKGEKWRTNKIILCEEYSLFDVETIKKFNLKITSKYITWACMNNNVKILDWWLNSGLPLEYSEDAIDSASGLNYLKVLEWWVKSGLPLKYSEKAMYYASKNNNIDVLDWWIHSGLELKYDEKALDSASQNRRIDVLEWWKNSGLPLKYSEYSEILVVNGDINVQKWWKNSGLKFKVI